MRKSIAWMLLGLLCIPMTGWSESETPTPGAPEVLIRSKGKRPHAADATLGVDYIGMKAKGGWTAVVIAIQNQGTQDAEFECCEMFLENDANYAVASLTRDEMQVVIHNRAKTAATIGTLIGIGLGIGGAVAGSEELIYAGLGAGVLGSIVGAVGEASAEGEQRSFVIDDIMRVRTFPAGLKVAGVAYFPPRKKWPDSKQLHAIHVTYKIHGKQHRVAVPVASP